MGRFFLATEDPKKRRRMSGLGTGCFPKRRLLVIFPPSPTIYPPSSRERERERERSGFTLNSISLSIRYGCAYDDVSRAASSYEFLKKDIYPQPPSRSWPPSPPPSIEHSIANGGWSRQTLVVESDIFISRERLLPFFSLPSHAVDCCSTYNTPSVPGFREYRIGPVAVDLPRLSTVVKQGEDISIHMSTST
ncbi:hypothetical protein TRV_05764 [Trichophyton verrucosum HKI 0517]|uniref:Uncharacterized protein n=1 Tax=Trichophyton verrucosum (strain HKI 0517) TaxID=663202 RepID=D4DF22_TRIVH|nr:uncharacterized protein TRV_05764 [Trichophyton verrucosum HKI 0517]EFE39551.1 hypothetical protein TRV_05764 [Trichophyton verrucosum HKI 0517]